MKKCVFIIVLNWNGWKDTIECLESIRQLRYNNYRIVLIDNGSNDNSLEQIKSWANGEINVTSQYINCLSSNKKMYIVEYDKSIAEAGGDESLEKRISSIPSHKRLVIINNNENLGFACGCNVGIRYALGNNAEYVWLLNNDTVVENESLSGLVNFLEQKKNFVCVTGQIRFYNNPKMIWNCGGRLTWYGARKYYFANDSDKSVPKNGYRPITFVTGCAPLFRSQMFKESGLLSEQFFFGEEDFEISLRMKKRGYKVACLYNAIIYHKVSATIGALNKKRNVSSTHIYYMSRFINMRNYMSPFTWNIWKLACSIYIIPMLIIRYKYSFFQASSIMVSVYRDSVKLKKIDKKYFENCMGLN